MKTLLFFAFFSLLHSSFALTKSAKLDAQELQALKDIWKRLGKTGKEWVFVFQNEPCSGGENSTIGQVKMGSVDIQCNCFFESNTICRIIGIHITSQNVSTTIPSEFTMFQHLRVLDLNRNYLSGTIPSEWATMRLSTLSVMGNRLSGSFPTALTRMITLTQLLLSSNDFTGQLPVALAKLTNLTELHIQGCAIEGPFPSSISSLTNLIDLRISDLKGGASTFPSLENMTQLRTLVLRNCFIHGAIPDYFHNLLSLINLDLSFNNLTGEIPSSLFLLKNAEYIYLTENNLTGPLPQWVLSSPNNVDVSYNQFAWDVSAPRRCEQGTINFVESYGSSTNTQHAIDPCLWKNFPCTKSNAQR